MKFNMVQIKQLRVFEATPSIRRETNYVEQDESEEIENQNIGPLGLADEGERIHSIVDEMEAEASEGKGIRSRNESGCRG